MPTRKALLTMKHFMGRGPQRSAIRQDSGAPAPIGNGLEAGDFDPAFYVRHHADLRQFSPAEAASHWTRFGAAEGRAGSPSSLLRRHRNIDRLPAGFDAVDYVFLNHDLALMFREDWEFAFHYLEFGVEEGRPAGSGVLDPDFVADLYGVGLPEGAGLADLKRALADGQIDAGARVYPSLDHLLRFHGFGPVLPRRMDGEFYYLTNLLGRDPYAPRHLARCVRHFCEIGLRELRLLREEFAFDPAFFERTYGPVSIPPGEAELLGREGALYRRWVNDAARAPNPRLWLEARTGADVPSLDRLHLETYRYASLDLVALGSPEETAAHLFLHGLFEKRHVPIDAGNAGIFAHFADRLWRRADELDRAEEENRPPELEPIHPDTAFSAGEVIDPTDLRCRAKTVFDLVCRSVPNNHAITQLVGERLVVDEEYGDALDRLERGIAAGSGGRWTYLHAATAARKLGDLRRALEILTLAAARLPGDVLLGRERRVTAGRYFNAEMNIARAMVWAGRYRDAKARLAEAARLATPPEPEAAPARAIRSVAILANMDLEQCRFYRVEQKVEHLLAAGYQVSVYNVLSDVDRFIDESCLHQAAIFYRVAATPDVSDAIVRARTAGLLTFYDMDDLVFDSDLFPDAFDDYAGMLGRREYAELHIGPPLFAHAMSLCDFGLASTPSLAARMERLCRTGRVFVHRNAFGSKHEAWAAKPHPEPIRGAPVTIFYGSGTKAHNRDFAEIVAPALERICERYGDRVRVVLMGHVSPAAPGSRLATRVTLRPPSWDIDEYWSVLAGADINLAVLHPTPLTDAKSEIKWLEAAMLGVPSVVSRTATYDEVVQDGIDGFLCGTGDEFFRALDRLVKDAALRRSVGDQARRTAIESYGLATMAANLRGVLDALSPGEPARPKLLLVNVFYPPQAIGGATRVVADNVRDLRELDPEADIEVFTTIEGADRPYERMAYGDGGVRVVGVTTPHNPDGERTPLDERMGAIFERHLADTRPALIHFHCVQRLTASVVHAAIRQKIPYLITLHDAWWISRNQFLMDEAGVASTYDYGAPTATLVRQGTSALRRMEAFRAPLETAEAVLAVSEPFAEVYRACGLDRVTALPNGVSPLPRAPRPGRRSRVVLGHIGGLERHKGVELFRLAVSSRRFENLSVVVVDNSRLPGYSKPDMWGTTPVEFIGKIPQSDVPVLYAGIDVLVAPSLWEESFGLVTREAIAAGCWVLASDRGAIAEPVLDGLNGHVVAVEDIGGLVAAFERIDADPARYLAAPPPGPALRTSLDQARDLAGIYRDVLAGH